jgi:nucleoside-diphosphate-sugar epimerase
VKVLVTGAAGFIGRHVTARLARENGIVVRAGSRSGDPVVPGSEACRLDILDPVSLAAAVAGTDAVVHCAVGDQITTVNGTDYVLRAAKQAGIRRLIHLSSISVYGRATGLISETTPTIPPGGAGYAHWKAAAEALCRQASGPGFEVVMLRPTIVYGAGCELWVRQLARRILSGRWGMFGDAGEGICNLVHVTDVAEAVGAALLAGLGEDGVFNINGPEALTWNAWFAHFATALGQAELPPVSPAAWRRRSRMALPIKALVRAAPPLRKHFATYLLGAPAASELDLFALKATYPISQASARLQWRPRVGLTEGTQDALRWLRQTGIVT